MMQILSYEVSTIRGQGHITEMNTTTALHHYLGLNSGYLGPLSDTHY